MSLPVALLSRGPIAAYIVHRLAKNSNCHCQPHVHTLDASATGSDDDFVLHCFSVQRGTALGLLNALSST